MATEIFSRVQNVHQQNVSDRVEMKWIVRKKSRRTLQNTSYLGLNNRVIAPARRVYVQCWSC